MRQHVTLSRWWRRPSAVFLSPGVVEVSEALTQVVPSHAQALLPWRDWCEAHAGQRCLVGLSSQWLLHAVVPVDQAMSRVQALDGAWQQWVQYFGLEAPSAASASAWRVRAVKVAQAWLVTAMPRQIVADVKTVADAHGVRVLWMGPWWARGVQRWWLARPGQRGIVSNDRRVLLMREPGWCVGLSQVDGGLAEWGAWRDDDGDGDPLSAVSSGQVLEVRVGTASTLGTGSQAVLWDDVFTRALLEGQAAPWTGAA